MEADQQLQVTVEKLSDDLRALPDDMRVFPKLLRDLYAENNLGSHSSTGKMFTQLRNDTKRDAMVYISILPSLELLIQSMCSFFSNYEDKNFDGWSLGFNDMLKELKVAKELSYLLKYMHEEIVKSFKKTEEKYQICYTQWKTRPNKGDKIRESWQITKVPRLVSWSVVGGLSFLVMKYFNVCNNLSVVIASASLLTFTFVCNKTRGLSKYYADRVLKEDKVKDIIETINIVSRELCKFMDNIYTVISFFIIIESEIIRLQNLGMVKDQYLLVKDLRIHYEVFKRKAKDIKRSCKSIICVLPNVKSDFDAIPAEDTERLNIDRMVQEMIEGFLSKNPHLTSVKEHVLSKCLHRNVSFQ